MRTFNYSVLENIAPVLSAPIDPIVISSVGQSVEIELPSHFSDEDGEKMEYKVNSLDTDILGAELVDGKNLRITTRALGLGQVRASAFDAMGANARCDISVLVREPGEKVTLLEGPVFSDKLTILAAEKETPTTIRLVAASGTVVAQTSGQFSAFNPVVLDTSQLAPGLYTLYVDIAGDVVRRSVVKK